MAAQEELVGRGWAFPLQVTARGKFALVTEATDIEQSIQIILGTMPGERVMRPNFGCRAWELVFAPNNAATRSLLAHYVQQALEFWEPRIDLLEVSASDEPPYPYPHPRHRLENIIWITIQYQIKRNYDPRSLVYPFYIMGEEAT